MPRMITQLFHEIIETVETDIEALEIEMMTTDGDEAPNEDEKVAIIRVQLLLRTFVAQIRAEIPSTPIKR